MARHVFHFSIAMLVLTATLLACTGKTDPGPIPAPTASSAAGKAPVAVVTVPARQGDLDVVLEAIGSVTALASVEVKAQTTGVITQVHVREGQFVQAGQLLFTLDARADEANVARLDAQMARNKALLADAQRQLARSRDLVARNFISQGALDTNQAQVDAQSANLAADRAALAAAKLALAYNRVHAPAAGRLGAITVYPGTVVQANQTTLVTVTQLDPINVSFNLPQRALPGVLAGLQDGAANAVQVSLPEGRGTRTGRVHFVDNMVDAATGTVKVRARFTNPDGALWPGSFVTAALVSKTLQGAVLVPTAAIIQSTRGSIVYLAVKDKAVLRPVKVLAAQGEESAVTGVNAGDMVVLDGRQNLRPDTPVTSVTPAAKRAASSASPVPPASSP
ncbi:MAG: efflux RND transporter periplasmic adaptor subunit [Rhodoferax sp.]|nr:efflux RND transporter periplasmic adaptor subunit [Rhodoferax sp.]